ncbi:hypothetical protein PORCRE_1810 [Porphyromonas crevioricanis JCM 15906]|uniref:Uncharacterized protein n=1 Tax=Porphyromonas crevioricanis JCM 15906 TaxID=1305617 RepID=T1CSG9_9PORP|nr:hypothetical protein PORCRE_1810 [Porphyromonas crevioricanis JCM 15906]GAD08556.1 hypothetical protein PORCAN_2204 [Porphyromonas crevioricanis JCM 13913]
MYTKNAVGRLADKSKRPAHWLLNLCILDFDRKCEVHLISTE